MTNDPKEAFKNAAQPQSQVQITGMSDPTDPSQDNCIKICNDLRVIVDDSDGTSGFNPLRPGKPKITNDYSTHVTINDDHSIYGNTINGNNWDVPTITVTPDITVPVTVTMGDLDPAINVEVFTASSEIPVPENQVLVGKIPTNLYSSIKVNIPDVKNVAVQWMSLDSQAVIPPAITKNKINGLRGVIDHYMSRLYLRFFTYGYKEVLTTGTPANPEIRGSGGTIEEALFPIASIYDDSPGDTQSWPVPLVTDRGLADRSDTNIMQNSIRRFSVDVAKCKALHEANPAVPYATLLESGVLQKTGLGFVVNRIRLEILNHDYLNDDATSMAIRRLFLSSIIQIEKFALMSMQEIKEPSVECVSLNDYAYEEMRDRYWQPVYAIDANRCYSEETRINLVEFDQTTEDIDGDSLNVVDLDVDLKTYTESTSFDLTKKVFELHKGNTDGHTLTQPIALMPGDIWRARLIFDPRSLLMTLSKINKLSNMTSGQEDTALAGIFSEMKFRLSLDGLQTIYEEVPTT